MLDILGRDVAKRVRGDAAALGDGHVFNQNQEVIFNCVFFFTILEATRRLELAEYHGPWGLASNTTPTPNTPETMGGGACSLLTTDNPVVVLETLPMPNYISR